MRFLLPSFIPKAEKYLSYKHFTAIPNAVPEAGVQAHPGEKKKEYVITSVGRLTGRTKRQHLLIEAFALLAEDFPQWKVNFWGADYDRAYVNDQGYAVCMERNGYFCFPKPSRRIPAGIDRSDGRRDSGSGVCVLPRGE